MNTPKKLILAPLFALLLSCSESSKDNPVQPEEEILIDRVSLTYEGQWNLVEGDLVPDNCNGVDSIANGKSYLSLWTIMRKEFSSLFSFAWKSHDTMTIFLTPHFNDTAKLDPLDAKKMRFLFSTPQIPADIRFLKVAKHPLAYKGTSSDSAKGYLDLTKDQVFPLRTCGDSPSKRLAL